MAGLTEPVPGATPLDEDDLAGMIPTWVTTRADLDAVENDGIQRAVLWVLSSRVRYTIEALLTATFADRLHNRMFGMVCGGGLASAASGSPTSASSRTRSRRSCAMC